MLNYSILKQLVQENDAFYISEQQDEHGETYHVFSYRLASYTEFCKEGALETRGSMFHIAKDGTATLVCRPMNKFFNAYENPFTMYPDTMQSTEIKFCLDKLDGSVINSFLNTKGELKLKSHTSINSEFAVLSLDLLKSDEEYYNEVLKATTDGYTCNFEYTSPMNRIVVQYPYTKLTVLNIRNRCTGELLTPTDFELQYPVLFKRAVKPVEQFYETGSTLRQVIEEVRSMKDIEGYVFILRDGSMCKVKTEWYCALHHTKDSIIVPSRLFDVVLNDASDDLRLMFSTDELSLKMISDMEQIVFGAYNTLVRSAETFYEENKHLERKDFALKVQDLENVNGLHGVIFTLYAGKVPDYKSVILKYKAEIMK